MEDHDIVCHYLRAAEILKDSANLDHDTRVTIVQLITEATKILYKWTPPITNTLVNKK